MSARTRSLVCSVAIATGLVVAGTAHAQQASTPAQPERNPERATNPASEEMKPLPADAPTVAWSESEVIAAKAECAKLLAGVSLEYEMLPPLREGLCGAPAPILLKSIGTAPKVTIEPPATVTCKLAAALSGWLDRKVQPEARAAFGAPVIKLSNASSYACRNRYNGTDTLLSEHALANALDISEFVFESGKKATVLASWPRLVADVPPPPLQNQTRVSASPDVTGSIAPGVREKAKADDEAEAPKATTIVAKSNPFVAPPTDAKHNPFVLPAAVPKAPPPKPPAEATAPETASASEAPMSEFVRKVHQDACDSFGTVLGPEANEAHRDHFHFDMKQRRARSFCQ